MAVVTRKIIEGGPTILTVQVFMQGDASGELNNYPLLSPADFTPQTPAHPTIRIQEIWWGFSVFSVVLSFSDDGANAYPMWVLSNAANSYIDFRRIGGLNDFDTSPPSDAKGKLLISTRGGFAQPGAVGSMILNIRKG